jgi:hypothetical protein
MVLGGAAFQRCDKVPIFCSGFSLSGASLFSTLSSPVSHPAYLTRRSGTTTNEAAQAGPLHTRYLD